MEPSKFDPSPYTLNADRASNAPPNNKFASSISSEARPSASWLNLVECWFSIVTRRCLQRGTFVSTDSLKSAIQDYIEQTNRDPKPFVWTKSVDEIHVSVKRFCPRTLNSHH
jgi:hypothetical protein